MKLATIAFLFLLLSCNANDNTDTKTVETQTTTTTDDDDKPGGDIESEIKLLNEQSLACIALMNKLETEQNAAYAAGDAEIARMIKTRIDSAARENVKIGQKLMALEK